MISIMTPSRGRSNQLLRMMHSAIQTAKKGNIEFIVSVDEDDLETAITCNNVGALFVVMTRNTIHSARWDKCLPLASGELLFHANDDIVFQTDGWDKIIEDEFEKYPDKILMVHGDDLGCQRENFGCHPCVHRKWVETLGYFIPPYFDGEWGDTWVNDLANRLGRRKFLPFVTEHMHYIFGKAEIDQTTKDYQERQSKQNPSQIYIERESERAADAQKLRAVMIP